MRLMMNLAGAAAIALAAACSAEQEAEPAAEVAEASQEAVQAEPVETADPLPVTLDREGFAVMIADAGPVYIAGQPTEAALEAMDAEGVSTVINLRTADEMSNLETVSFDEAAKVSELGMDYVQIEQGPEETLTPAALDAFAAAMAEADGKVLVHCGSGVRASHMWAAYLVREKGLSMEEALAQAEAMNLRSEAPVRSLLGMEN